MSLELKSLHVRICAEAHEVLSSEAELRDADLVEICREVLEQWALGSRHRHILLARRLERAGLTGKRRDSHGND